MIKIKKYKIEKNIKLKIYCILIAHR